MTPGTVSPGTHDAPRAAAIRTLWLTSFSDLMLLTLCFFVLLYATAAPDPDRWQALSRSLGDQRAEGPGGMEAGTGPAPAPMPTRRALEPLAVDLGYLRRVIEQKTRTDPALAAWRVTPAGDRLILSLPGDLLFGTAETALTPAASGSVRALAQILDLVDNRVAVTGHADPAALAPGAAWETNWELSLARADALARALSGAGYARPVRVSGQGDARFADLWPGLTPQERARLARRVDVVILAEGSGADDAG